VVASLVVRVLRTPDCLIVANLAEITAQLCAVELQPVAEALRIITDGVNLDDGQVQAVVAQATRLPAP